MTSGNAVVEAITSDPVIVEVSDAEKLAGNVGVEAPVAEKKADKEEPLEDDVRKLEIDDGRYGRSSYREPAQVVYRNYSRSRSPEYIGRRRPIHDGALQQPVLANTGTLNGLLEETDVCVQTIKGQLVYLTTHPFHSADLQKISWLFTLGVPDGWSQKPTGFLAGNGFQFEMPRGNRGRNDYYDDDYDVRSPRGAQTPIARLGAALRVFKDDSNPDTSKVKFLIAVQAKNDASWVKLLVCHSRQATVAEIFHAILNSHAIVFVGAVLRNVAVPAENPNKKPKKLQRVGSVQEAEEVDQGVIGVIC